MTIIQLSNRHLTSLDPGTMVEIEGEHWSFIGVNPEGNYEFFKLDLLLNRYIRIDMTVTPGDIQYGRVVVTGEASNSLDFIMGEE